METHQVLMQATFTFFQPELVTNDVVYDEVHLAHSSLPLLTRRRDDNTCV
jgi:hypothetical protein